MYRENLIGNYPSYGPDDASRGYYLDASFGPRATDKFSWGCRVP